jgi:hypothetical protein
VVPVTGGRRGRAERGQVVLLAAVVVAVALVAMGTAYHGLGYHGDVATRTEVGTPDPMRSAETRLSAAVDAAGVGGAHPWTARNETVNETRSELARAEAALRAEAAGERAVFVIREDPDLAAAWAAEDCPGGERRAFGACRAVDGVVVQERANETALVGVALNVTYRSPSTETTATLRLAAH